MPQIECPDSETLSKWLDGQLSPDEAEFHERHLEECESCLGAIDGLDPSDSLAETLSANSIITHDDAASVEVLISKIQQSPASTSWCGSFDLDISSFLEPPQADDELGRLGEHRILEFLGTGGMGIVFKAEDTRLQRVVAIKLMHPVLCASRHASRRFMREARATAALEHEHIVTIYNVGEDRGLPWLSMHLLEGESLHDRLMNVEKLPIGDAVRIGREIAVGLEVAHARGLLHRDIKPDNIWLREGDDHTTILDFGLARIADEDSLVTRQGSILGTPDYMAPEQARGQDVDERCDLFSLGCVLYRMITGVSPFSRGNVMATLHAVVEENVPPACDLDAAIPQPFSDLIERLMAKSPDDRPHNVTEVVSELKAFESETPDVAVEAQRPSGRRTVINGLLGILIGFLAAFVIQWSTDRGTLLVEVQDETLDVTFKNAGLIIKDADSGEEITLRIGPNKLPSGEYEILVRNSSSKFELLLREFALVRGATKRLSVSWKKTAKDIDIPLKVSRDDTTKSQPAIATAPNWLTESATVLPKPGQALTSSALVQQPALLTGLASWSVEPRQHRGAVHEIALHPDGHRVATSGSDGMIRIWNSDNGQLIEVVPAHDRRIGDLVWSHSGTVLASCEFEGEIRLWRVGNGPQPTKMIRRIQRRATALAFSPDDRIRAFNEGETHLWSLEENRVMPRLGITGRMTDHPWSPDGKLFLTRGSSGFTIWDFQTRRALETTSHAIYSAGWSESGDYLAVTNIEIRNDRQIPMIDIWNVKRLERVRTISLETNLKFPKKNYVDMPRSVRATWSPDGRHFVVSRSFGQNECNGIVSRKGVRLERWSVDVDKPASVVQLFSGTKQPWNSSPELSWSADGRRLAISFFDHALVMDTKTSRVQAIGAPANQIYLYAMRNSVLTCPGSDYGI